MPDGRFISKSISDNEHLGQVSVEAALLFSWCIPHLDRDGRMDGRVRIIKSRAVVWREDITEDSIPGLIAELSPLVRWYESKGVRVLEFLGFRGAQKGDSWYKKEAASRFPGHSDSTLDLLSTYSRPTPELVGVREVQVEVKGQVEVKETTGAAPPAVIVEKSYERPAFTDSLLLDDAEKVLGLGKLTGPQKMTNKSIIMGWLYKPDSKRDRTDIYSFIHGAADLRDRDMIGWLDENEKPTTAPGMPITLAAGMTSRTVADQGDGTVLRNLYDVAVEHWRKNDTAPTRRKRPTGTMGRLSVAVPTMSTRPPSEGETE